MFKALLAQKTGEKISTSVVEMDEQQLMPGDVSVAVDYSTLNYKDALAISGRAEIIRQFPLIPGIDFAGTVEASSHAGIAVGELGTESDPPWRLCSESARERRLARENPSAAFDKGRHGNRHGGLHGNAERPRPRTWRPHPTTW